MDLLESHSSSNKVQDPFETLLKFLAILVTVVGIVILVKPFVSNNGIMKTHDILFQLVFTREFASAFFDGQFPVRYVNVYGSGSGVPEFNFYPPGFYYLFTLPKMFGLSNLASFEFVSAFLWLLSALFMFLYSKRHFGILGGSISAFLYAFAPYHILQYFIRASMAEFTAIAFIPGIFWALESYWEKGKGRYFFATSAIFGIFAISHVLTVAIFSPVIVLYQTMLFLKYKSRKLLIISSLALLLGFLIAATFLLPSAYEAKYTLVQGTFHGAGDYHLHFVCPLQFFVPNWDYGPSLPGCDDQMSFQIGIPHWILLIAAVFFLARLVRRISFKKFEYTHWLLIFFLGAFLISLFMMLDASSILWQNLPYFQYFQFPWRYLGLAAFSVSILGGGIFFFVVNKTRCLLIYVGIIVLMLSFYSGYLRPVYYIDENIINYDNDSFLKRVENEIKDHEIIRKKVPSGLLYKDVTKVLPENFKIPNSEVEVTLGVATISKIDLKADRKVYGVNVEQNAQLRFYTNYFPGWQVYMDNQKTQFSYKNEYGYIDVVAPFGNHEITLLFEDTPIRKIGNLLSVTSLFTALFIAFFMEKRMRMEKKC